MQRKLALLTIICIQFLIPVRGQSSPDSFIETKKWRFATELDWFRTEANYEDSGNSFERLGGNKSYTLLDFRFSFLWRRNKNSSFFGSTGYGAAESRGNDSIRKGQYGTNLKLGGHYLLPFKKFDILQRLELTLPFRRVTSDTDQIILEEGAFGLEFNFYFLTSFSKRADSYLQAGLNYRDEGRALLLPFSGGIKYRWSSFWFGGDLLGSMTVLEDKHSSNPGVRNQVTSRVNGGSRHFYAVNPSLLEAQGWFSIGLSKLWDLKLGIRTGLNGTNQSVGNHFFISLGYQGGKTKTAQRGSEIDDIEREDARDYRRLEEFEENPIVEGIDPKILEENEEFLLSDEERRKRKLKKQRKKKKRRKKRKKKKHNSEIDDELKKLSP